MQLLVCLGKSIVDNVKRLCDGGFYAAQSFKTAIAKPMLHDVVFLAMAKHGLQSRTNTKIRL